MVPLYGTVKEASPIGGGYGPEARSMTMRRTQKQGTISYDRRKTARKLWFKGKGERVRRSITGLGYIDRKRGGNQKRTQVGKDQKDRGHPLGGGRGGGSESMA